MAPEVEEMRDTTMAGEGGDGGDAQSFLDPVTVDGTLHSPAELMYVGFSFSHCILSSLNDGDRR